MITNIESNKTLIPMVTELFLTGRKLNLSLVLYNNLVFLKVTKAIRLNSTHYFIMKTKKKRQLQQMTSNHSSCIDFKDFMKLYQDSTKEPFSFLVKS